MHETSSPSISLIGRFINTLIEKIKRKSAQEIGNKIAGDVKFYNSWARDGKCNCGGGLKNKIIGSDGLFTSTSTIFSCMTCGEDYRTYSNKRYLSIELERAGIKQIGNEYRYMFWRPAYALAIFMAGWLGFLFYSIYSLFVLK